MKKIILIGLVLILLGGLLFAQNVGDKCPTFNLVDLKGVPYDAGQSLGKKPLVIWFTNFDELASSSVPRLVEFAQNNRDVDFIIISVNARDKSAAQKAKDEYLIPFPVLVDPDGSVCLKFSNFCEPGLTPVNNFFLVGKDRTIKLANHYPGIPFSTVSSLLKELK